MANKKISELPYINGSKISGNTLVPLVTYFSAVTGDTVHTYISDFKNYLTSGLTGNTNVLVTGGTYSAGTITFTNSTGGTFNVTGLTTGSTSTISGNYLPLSGGTVTGGTIFQSGLTATTISATTYLNLPLATFSGGTVTGPTTFTNGLTATTVSATTYQNLPTDVRVTGSSYSNNVITFTNNTGGTFNVLFNTFTGGTFNGNLTVTGNTSLKGLTATTVSATTYQNLPTDIRVTGGTYSNGTATFTNNTGGTFNVTGLFTGTTKYFGSFYDTQDQTGITGTVLTMSASTANSFNNGITLRETSKFGIENSGVYNLSFSAQMFKVTGNSSTKAFIWLSQNGTDVPIGTRQITFPLEGVYVVASWNFFFEASRGDYVELKWQIYSDVNNQLYIKNEKSSPETPSLIVNINQVN